MQTLNPLQIEVLRGILAGAESVPANCISVQELWAKYAAFKKSQISHSTWKNGFLVTFAHVNRCPLTQLGDARAIADWLIENCTPDTARRQLIQLSAACKWGVKRQLVTANPFEGMAREVKAPSYKLDCQPFTESERRQIISAYEAHPVWSKYAPLVKFFFLTGCRTSEALGLRWKNVATDFSSVNFCEAYILGKLKTGTKTGARNFPCSPALSKLLASLKPIPCNPEAPVFSDAGRPMSQASLGNSWKGKLRGGGSNSLGIVGELVRQGAIACYRSQYYHTRHTFITECLAAGIPVKVVAAWVGNSPEIIYKHYAGSGGDWQPPDLV